MNNLQSCVTAKQTIVLRVSTQYHIQIDVIKNMDGQYNDTICRCD
jgi:hypothetical protein